MNAPITREQLAAFAVESDKMLSELAARDLETAKRHGAPFSKRQEGRKRRKARRHVRAAKAAWLNS